MRVKHINVFATPLGAGVTCLVAHNAYGAMGRDQPITFELSAAQVDDLCIQLKSMVYPKGFENCDCPSHNYCGCGQCSLCKGIECTEETK